MLMQCIATAGFDRVAPFPGQIVRQAIAQALGDVLRIFRRQPGCSLRFRLPRSNWYNGLRQVRFTRVPHRLMRHRCERG